MLCVISWSFKNVPLAHNKDFHCVSVCRKDLGQSSIQSAQVLTADPGVASLIPGYSNTFADIDHEILFRPFHLPSVDSKRVVFSYKRKYMHELLVNRLIKLAQEKMCLGELTVPT